MTPGPYIVSEHAPCREGCTVPRAHPPVYREAFATLEEAVARSWARVGDRAPDTGWRAGWPDSRAVEAALRVRGSISLPDGSVIEVEATKSWHRLAHETGDPELLRRALAAGEFVHQHPSLCAAILAAWNAEHGIGLGVSS